MPKEAPEDIFRIGKPRHRFEVPQPPKERGFATIEQLFEMAKGAPQEARKEAVLSLGDWKIALEEKDKQRQREILKKVENLIEKHPDSENLQNLYASMLEEERGEVKPGKPTRIGEKKEKRPPRRPRKEKRPEKPPPTKPPTPEAAGAGKPPEKKPPPSQPIAEAQPPEEEKPKKTEEAPPVYLSMVPELRRKVGALPEEETVVIRDEETGEPIPISAIPVHKLKTIDQVSAVALEELNSAIKDKKKFELDTKRKLGYYVRRAEQLARTDDEKEQAKCLRMWVNSVQNFQEFVYDVWKKKIGGGSEALIDILRASNTGFPNDAIALFMQDPGIEEAFHTIKADVEDDAFIKGNKDKGVQGGANGAIEKLGYYTRLVTGQAFYDFWEDPVTKEISQTKICSSIAYTPYRLIYFLKYAEGKGWYEAASRLNKFLAIKGKKLEIYPYLTMWHSPNAMADFWLDNFDRIGWKNQARTLSIYGDFDERLGDSDFYTIEEFDALPEDQQRAKRQTAFNKLNNLPPEQRGKILRRIVLNNLLRTHEVKVENKKREEFKIIRPLLDLDEEEEGERVIDLGRLIRKQGERFGLKGAGNLMNNFYTYTEYAFKTFSIFEDLARTDPEAHAERLKILQDLMNPEKGFRHLFERIEEDGKPREMLALRREIIGGIIDYYSEMYIRYLWEERKKGIRTPLALMTNQLLRFGLFKGVYRKEFESAGIYGRDWANLYENPLSTEEKVAKILAKFGNGKEVITTWLKENGIVNTRGEGDFEAFVAFAGLKITPGKSETNPEGRRVQYMEYDFDKQAYIKLMVERLGIKKPIEDLSETDREGIEKEWMGLVRGLVKKLEDPLSPYYNFFEKMNEDDIIESMIDLYLDKEFNKKSENKINRRWGLPISWYEREKRFHWIKRDMRYTTGELKGKFVLDQLKLNEKGQLEFDKDKKQPSFAHLKDGYDRIGSLMEGTGELFPGMVKRLTPLYLYYNKNRMTNLVLSVFADPKFRLETIKNSYKNWELDHGFWGVMNPPKLNQFFDLLQAKVGEDEEWVGKFKKEANVNPELVNDFEDERKELRIRNIEGKLEETATAEDLARFSKVISRWLPVDFQEGIPIIRSRKELVAAIRGAAVGSIPVAAVLASGALGTVSFGLALALAGIIGIGTPFVFVFPALDKAKEGNDDTVRGWARIVGEGIDLRFWRVPVFGGVKILGIKIPENIDLRFLKVPGWGILGERVHRRSPEQLISGYAPVWDDAVPVEPLVDFFFVEPRQKLLMEVPIKG